MFFNIKEISTFQVTQRFAVHAGIFDICYRNGTGIQLKKIHPLMHSCPLPVLPEETEILPECEPVTFLAIASSRLLFEELSTW